MISVGPGRASAGCGGLQSVQGIGQKVCVRFSHVAQVLT